MVREGEGLREGEAPAEPPVANHVSARREPRSPASLQPPRTLDPPETAHQSKVPDKASAKSARFPGRRPLARDSDPSSRGNPLACPPPDNPQSPDPPPKSATHRFHQTPPAQASSSRCPTALQSHQS